MRIRTVCPRISRAVVPCPPDSGCLVTPARAGWTGKLAPSARNCSRAMGASTCGFLRGSKADRRDIEHSTSGSPHPDMQRGLGLLHLGTERPATHAMLDIRRLPSLPQRPHCRILERRDEKPLCGRLQAGPTVTLMSAILCRRNSCMPGLALKPACIAWMQNGIPESRLRLHCTLAPGAPPPPPPSPQPRPATATRTMPHGGLGRP